MSSVDMKVAGMSLFLDREASEGLITIVSNQELQSSNHELSERLSKEKTSHVDTVLLWHSQKEALQEELENEKFYATQLEDSIESLVAEKEAADLVASRQEKKLAEARQDSKTLNDRWINLVNERSDLQSTVIDLEIKVAKLEGLLPLD